jgi:CheY-like chemotaxis protein
VKQPLALVLYEKLMPGSQLVNRLRDINYRVLAVSNPADLASMAQAGKPMLIFADLDFGNADVCAVIASLRHNPDTQHIPIVAFTDDVASEVASASQTAGATLVVTDSAVLTHLPQLLEQALRVE